jgi:hypothetical protein
MTIFIDWLRGLSDGSTLLFIWSGVVLATIIRKFTRRLTPYFTWHDINDPPGQNAIDRAGDRATSCIMNVLWLAIVVIAVLATLKVQS